jgi:ADP-heptose:LPS heptosyltransferase
LLSGADIRISARHYTGAFINHPVSVMPGHYSQMNHDLLAPLGISGRAACPVIDIDPAWEAKAAGLLAALKVEPQEKLAGLHPGAGQAGKRWGPGNFAAAGRQLADRGYRIVVLGGHEESDLAAGVAGDIGPRALSVAGRGGLGLALALMSRCRLVISNDSGLAHCSAALGIPTVAVFGPTDPAKCAPRGPRVGVVASGRRCAPCYRPPGRYLCRDCPPPCLDIPVGRVMEEAGRLVGGI